MPYFQACFFHAELFLKHTENKKSSRGVWGHVLPRKMLKIYIYTVVVILALFEQFFGKVCLNFLPLNLSVLPNMMHLVRTLLIMRA